MKYSDAAPVQIMSPSRDFFFDSAATGAAALYVSAPSSPKPFGEPSMDYFYHHASAPTSPTRASAIYNAQFDWDEKAAGGGEAGFGFSFAGQAAEVGALDEYSSLTPADELFEAGKIRPLKKPLQGERGRERRDPSSSSSSSVSASRSRRASRSLSPMRGEVGRVLPPAPSIAAASSDTSTSFDIKADGIGGGSGSKRWRLRDLFLFRSASEGRATGRESKDPLRRYTAISPSTASSSSSSSVARGTSGGRPAAPEIHYRASRAANEELRKKTTPLAYQRLGLFGSVFSRGRS